MLDNLVDQTVFLRLLRRKYAVAFDVFFDLIKSLSTVIRDDPRRHLAHTQNLFSHDANVRRLS